MNYQLLTKAVDSRRITESEVKWQVNAAH